ncbi:hypothetical protein Tco_0246101 [Tanacetum coccineum]
MMFDHNSSNLAPQRQKASYYDNSGPTPQLQKTSVHNIIELEIHVNNNEPSSIKLVLNIVPTTNKTDTSLQELELLFSLMYEEYFNGGNQNHPLEQVHGNPSKHVQTRRQLATDPEMCMFTLTVSKVGQKNIKEAMADHAWIKAMHEDLY